MYYFVQNHYIMKNLFFYMLACCITVSSCIIPASRAPGLHIVVGDEYLPAPQINRAYMGEEHLKRADYLESKIRQYTEVLSEETLMNIRAKDERSVIALKAVEGHPDIANVRYALLHKNDEGYEVPENIDEQLLKAQEKIAVKFYHELVHHCCNPKNYQDFGNISCFEYIVSEQEDYQKIFAETVALAAGT